MNCPEETKLAKAPERRSAGQGPRRPQAGQGSGRPRTPAGGRPREPAPAGPRAALRGFRRGTRGATAITFAISISVLVVAFASLIEIAKLIFVWDENARASRAAARAVSLLASAPASEAALEQVACDAVKRELGWAEDADCDRWTIEIEAFPTPAALLAGSPRGSGSPLGGENADLVLVRLSQPWQGWLPGALAPEEEGDDPGADPPAGGIVVAAVARNEREITR